MFGLHYITQGLPQNIFIPAAPLTEANLPDQTGRVHIVSGAYAGVGEQLMQILYSKNAVVYLAGRSPDKTAAAIALAREKHPSSTGRLEFLRLDLSDLTTIKPAVEAFLAKETRLDVLVNNAGVMLTTWSAPLAGAQGHELHMATNCLGPFLLTKLLTPILRATARTSHKDSVRVLWASSLAVNILSPTGGITLLEEEGDGKTGPPWKTNFQLLNYGQSKVGNYFYANEYHRRSAAAQDGIVSVAFNPGTLNSGLYRHLPAILQPALFLGHPSRQGAYTELFCGWSDEVTSDNCGAFVIPWGRLGDDYVRSDVLQSVRDSKTDPDALPRRFWEWSEKETAEFA